jgi:hypothetical protein
VYNEAMDSEVMAALKAVGVERYTKWPRVMGSGKTSGPHLDSHIWPGANAVAMFVLDDETAKKAMEVMRGLRKKMGHEGIKAFILPVEDITE